MTLHRWKDLFREWQDAPNAGIADDLVAYAVETRDESLPGFSSFSALLRVQKRSIPEKMEEEGLAV